MPMDGRTDRQRERERVSEANMTKLMPAFRNFANAPKNVGWKTSEYSRLPLGRSATTSVSKAKAVITV
jgi:hypothetical protein